MVLSPVVLLWTLLILSGRSTESGSEEWMAAGGICLHAGSLASSSFVEEEQYTYHFLVSTLFLILLRRAFQQTHSGKTLKKEIAVSVVLLCGRLLRAWHRSGVNWAHLPDIAKWLDTVDVQIPTASRYAALVFVTASSCVLVLSRRHLLRKLLACCLCLSATLIFVYVDSESGQVPTLFGSASYPDQVPTLLARSVFGNLVATAALAITLLPWIEPLGEEFPLEAGVSSALQSTGRVLISCWCLLQLLLQQSVNAGPVALLLIQLLAAIVFFKQSGNNHSLWFQVRDLIIIFLSQFYQ